MAPLAPPAAKEIHLEKNPDPETPKPAWVTRGGLRSHRKDVRNHRLGGPPSIFPNLNAAVNHGLMAKEARRTNSPLSRTGHTNAGALIDHGLFGVLVRVRDMTKPE